MDLLGLILFGVCLVLYYVTKKQYPGWLFFSGFGAGVFLALLWSYIVRFVL